MRLKAECVLDFYKVTEGGSYFTNDRSPNVYYLFYKMVSKI